MRQSIWKIIGKSKADKSYVASEQQYQNLREILNDYDRFIVEEFYAEWNEVLTKVVNNPEFKRLHVKEGGIIDAADDDSFYVDFANWIVAQGLQLFLDFMNEGNVAIRRYIEKHHVPESDYMFECMSYAFH